MHILEALEQAKPNMTKSDLAVMNYIQAKGLEVCNAPISEMAKSCGVSHATITRFVRKFGYESLQAFKIALAKEVGSGENIGHLISVNIALDESSEDTVSKLTQLMTDTIRRTAKGIDHKSLARITSFFFKANRVYFIGKGNSGFVAADSAFKFNRIGIDSRAFIETHEMLMMCSMLKRRDLLVAFSNSGTTPEIIKACELAKQEGCKIIGITADKDSALAKMSDESLFYEIRETFLDSGSIYSKAAVIFIIDLIYTELCKKLGQDAIDAKQKTGRAISAFCNPRLLSVATLENELEDHNHAHNAQCADEHGNADGKGTHFMRNLLYADD